MEIAESIKKAPRWAWYTAGGVAIGAGAIRLYKNRTTADGETPLPDGGTTPAITGGDPYAASGGGSSPTLVPSVIVTGTGNGGSDATSGAAAGLASFAGIIDSTTGLIGTLEGFFNPIVLEQASTIHDQILQQGNTINNTVTGLIANAGSAPQPQQQNPTPIVAPSNVPAAPIAVAPSGPNPIEAAVQCLQRAQATVAKYKAHPPAWGSAAAGEYYTALEIVNRGHC